MKKLLTVLLALTLLLALAVPGLAQEAALRVAVYYRAAARGEAPAPPHGA